MKAVLSLLAKVDELLNQAKTIGEECYRMTVTGVGVSEEIVRICTDIDEICNRLSISCPTFRVSVSTLKNASNTDIFLDDAEELKEFIDKDGCTWSMILSKKCITDKAISCLTISESKENLLYFTESAVLEWVSNIDPFVVNNNGSSPSFDKDIIIWINNSELCFGGDRLAILPIGTECIPLVESSGLSINDEEVTDLVKLNANELLKIKPDFFIISWGDKNSDLAKKFMLLAIKSLIACISCELKKCEGEYSIIFKGTKVLVGSLATDCTVDVFLLQGQLLKTVKWIYSERKETRQQLVMDRLSLDMNSNQNFYSQLSENINEALQQSADSYAFVILDRKDAYHKEMRELLKDMRSQADMYASKVRDVVNNITRDMLGVFAFVGYSFLGKFDKANLTELIKSNELNLLVKFLAGYLILSCIMQLIIHLRDAHLTSKESEKWLKVLQRYTSREENSESFLEPIEKRKKTLYQALFSMFVIYVALALCIFNLSSIALYLLAPA